ncbi:MAG: hypothetical protein JO193_06905 [Candidatus Eremiobacteraeota bacterium]|nr:hypothetical protein [Candidatus Eremiobacteraeota bacterium]
MPLNGLSKAFPNRAMDGRLFAPWPMDCFDWNFPPLPHSFADFHNDYNQGANDGFVTSYENAIPPPSNQYTGVPMGYYTEKTLPVLYSLATQFTVCDHWYASMLSSTWPNRKYLHSGRRDNDNDTQTIPGAFGFQTEPMYQFIEKQYDPQTNNRLRWKCYFSDIPFLAGWYAFAAFHAFTNFSHVDQFVEDCQAERLPEISIVDPPFTLADDHPPQDPRLGEKFIGLVVDALTTSPSWDSSVLVILFDEAGGFYDHVVPPSAPEDNAVDTPLGFRVPAIIVSPFSKPGAVSVEAYDHTSIMQSIAERWKIDFASQGDSFGTRYSKMNAIWSALDFNATPRPRGVYTNAFNSKDVQALNWAANVRERLDSPLGDFERALERIFVLPELKSLDNRASAFDTLGKFEHSVITLKRVNSYLPQP